MTDPKLQELLLETSRTFALAIPTLPEPSREEVTVAYLLFRIADTFEDASRWDRERKVAALNDFSELLRHGDLIRAANLASEWAEGRPIPHEGYQDLLRETPRVWRAYEGLAPGARSAIQSHVLRTNAGMARTVERVDAGGALRLRDLSDLREYCYIVAGLVGEMLTELYLLNASYLEPHASDLRTRARWFGEGLQLVNILKDAADDAREGRVFLPDGVDRSAVFKMAREDLALAAEYVDILHRAGAGRGVLAFNALPMLLAWSTLDLVEREGPGSKISREVVFDLVARLNEALDRGEVLLSPVTSRP